MKQWIEQFEHRLDMLHSREHQEHYEEILSELVWMKQLTLDTWCAMNEHLEQIIDQQQASYRSRGTAYFFLNMYEQAARQFECEKRDNDRPIVSLYAAFSYLYIQQYEMAKRYFSSVCRTGCSSERFYAYCGLAELSVYERQYEKAIDCYEMALHINSDRNVVYNLGMCFFHLNQLDETIHCLERLLEEDDGDFATYYLFARCLLLLGNVDEAMKALLCASQLSTEKSHSLAIAYEFEESGHYLAAIECYKQLLGAGHMEQAVLHGLAWCYGLLDERSLSLKWFHELFKMKEPMDREMTLSFVWLLKKWNEEQLLQLYDNEMKQFFHEYPHYEQLFTSSFC